MDEIGESMNREHFMPNKLILLGAQAILMDSLLQQRFYLTLGLKIIRDKRQIE